MEQNKMGVMPINKLLLTMSLPMVGSMLVQALYNIVDSYFVSLVSREALTAVSQAFSAQNLMIGIATGTAVGMNALISRALGQGDRERANKIASNGVFLAIISYIAMLLFGFFGTDIYFQGMLAAGGEQDAMLDLVSISSSKWVPPEDTSGMISFTRPPFAAVSSACCFCVLIVVSVS